MRIAYRCECGGLLESYDSRRDGGVVVRRAKCAKCGESKRIAHKVEDGQIVLRRLRKDESWTVEPIGTDAKIEP